MLKLDIKKFFANIDHEILLGILEEYIPDQDIMWLLKNIIDSFGSDCFVAFAPRKFDRILSESASGAKQSNQRGLPLGNLTSQLFVNVYMNRFDQFVKQKLRVKYYIRYADDFVILSQSKEYLTVILSRMTEFLNQELKLDLHPDKIILKTCASGLDFLGWVNFPHHRVLRTATKRRMMKRIREKAKNKILQSYLGLIKHGNTFKVQQELLNNYWLFRDML